MFERNLAKKFLDEILGSCEGFIICGIPIAYLIAETYYELAEYLTDSYFFTLFSAKNVANFILQFHSRFLSYLLLVLDSKVLSVLNGMQPNPLIALQVERCISCKDFV